MRIAAGILMIILGTITGTFVAFVEVLLGWGDGSMNYASFILFAIIPAVFVIPGGVFCLKRKYWKLCFTSSLLLLFIDLYLFIAFNFYYRPTIPVNTYPIMIPDTSRFLISFLIWFVSLSGILPIIFVCLRKREWQEIQG
jgi:membrane protease YdiL (CAAX protease family)